MSTTLPFTEPEGPLRHVFLRDMVLLASIGVHPHEHTKRQRVCINVCMAVDDETARRGAVSGPDELSRVVDYEKLAGNVRDAVNAGHTRLVETLAERIAGVCLRNPRVRQVRVRVEKLDLFPDVHSLGVEIHRSRAGATGP